MNEIDCDVIQDLLPSYSDKVSSNSTNKIVEEHLESCSKCREALNSMNKKMDTETLREQDDEINYLKGYKKRRRIFVTLGIMLASIITLTVVTIIFIINWNYKNIIIDRKLYTDVNKFNVEYLYIKENTGTTAQEESFTYKTLEGYLYSDEYKNMYLTGECVHNDGEKEIYYKIAGQEVPKGFEFESSGIEIKINLEDESIEKIYIEDIKNNKKEIWNKDMQIMNEEEWKKWYMDEYVPKEIKESYQDNVPIYTSIWKHEYNKMLENK